MNIKIIKKQLKVSKNTSNEVKKYRIWAYNEMFCDEVGIYEGVNEKEAIENCRRVEMKKDPLIFGGLKLEAKLI